MSFRVPRSTSHRDTVRARFDVFSVLFRAMQRGNLKFFCTPAVCAILICTRTCNSVEHPGAFRLHQSGPGRKILSLVLRQYRAVDLELLLCESLPRRKTPCASRERQHN